MLVTKYPRYRIVNFDKLDYCSSLKNLDGIAAAPNYTFVKASGERGGRVAGGREAGKRGLAGKGGTRGCAVHVQGAPAAHGCRGRRGARPRPRRHFRRAGNPRRPPGPARSHRHSHIRAARTPPAPTRPAHPPQGSITSADLVNYVLRVEKVDTIMHFAAQTHVDNSFGNSITFTEANILGTHVLLEAAKEAKVKLFIHVSTDEVYGEGDTGVPSHEGSPLEPTNPYSATKAGAEYLVKAYARSFALPTIITRGNNVYGPHQYPEKIIPKFINQLMRGLPLTLHGTGANTRNYLYVEDVARAFDVILHRGAVGEIYNIGGDNEVSNIEVARSLLTLMGHTDRAGGLPAAEAAHIIFVPDRPFNDLRYPLDCRRLNDLGWREEVTWAEGLARTVAWYGKFSGNWSDVESALVAHPRRGWTGKVVVTGRADEDDDKDEVATILRERARAGSVTSLDGADGGAGGQRNRSPPPGAGAAPVAAGAAGGAGTA
jgi:UDP-glucose 4,6-dehydratase